MVLYVVCYQLILREGQRRASKGKIAEEEKRRAGIVPFPEEEETRKNLCGQDGVERKAGAGGGRGDERVGMVHWKKKQMGMEGREERERGRGSEESVRGGRKRRWWREGTEVAIAVSKLDAVVPAGRASGGRAREKKERVGAGPGGVRRNGLQRCNGPSPVFLACIVMDSASRKHSQAMERKGEGKEKGESGCIVGQRRL